ncbi:MAG: hypothetical protein GY808_08140 [Gammaproteobacteria bacterium]|nr:hypothetical protein [Gammaproteobacteria bacterium]
MLTSTQQQFILNLFIFIICSIFSLQLLGEEELVDIEYVSIDPVIITNYLKKRSRKPGFVQMKAQLSVRGKESADLVIMHMPLIRDYIVESLSFTQEKVIKDISSRNKIRAALSSGIQKVLTDNTGAPLVEELVITHFMWD